MKTLTHEPHAAHHDHGGAWAALLVVVILAASVWGAWKLGVMAGDRTEWRQRLPDVTSLRKGPSPQPMPIPTQRRPAVTSEMRR